VNKTKPTGEITGKINADANPLFFGQRCVISQQANWIKAGSTHEFRLYNADHKQLLTKVTVTGIGE
jgi:hypothetical protein